MYTAREILCDTPTFGPWGGGAKYTARVSAREILCATPTFDVIFKAVA